MAQRTGAHSHDGFPAEGLALVDAWGRGEAARAVVTHAHSDVPRCQAHLHAGARTWCQKPSEALRAPHAPLDNLSSLGRLVGGFMLPRICAIKIWCTSR